MKITSVELHAENSSDSVVLSFRDPSRSNSYNIKAIMGLDADEIVPRFYKGSGSSGRFYNLSLQKRDIVVRTELNPDFESNKSFSDLRDDLYKMIASSRTGVIDVKFLEKETVRAVLSGFVSKFETASFNKTPEVQITIKCSEPMLRAPNPTVLDPSQINPVQVVVPVGPVGEGQVGFTPLTEWAFSFYDTLSTAPHGFAMELRFLEPMTTLIIDDPLNTYWEFQATPINGFFKDDILVFSSELNKKHLYIRRGITIIHLADVIKPESVWPIMFPGQNIFRIREHEKIDFTAFSYHPTYWGV